MTFKQTIRRLFANLWHLCARLASDKIQACHHSSTEHAAWWEEFLIRCEQRAIRHAEFVPNAQQEDGPAPFVPVVRARTVDGLECVEWVKKYRAEKHCTLREAKDAWDVRAAEDQPT